MAASRVLALVLLLLTRPALAAETTRLDIVTRTGEHAFAVELADTIETRSLGLMYRDHLDPDSGMLFDFGREDMVFMWMKNTHIPLDMIFAARDGVVVSIHPDAKPMSLATISSQKPAWAVLEVNAGVAKRIGLQVGDRLRHALFGP